MGRRYRCIRSALGLGLRERYPCYAIPSLLPQASKRRDLVCHLRELHPSPAPPHTANPSPHTLASELSVAASRALLCSLPHHTPVAHSTQYIAQHHGVHAGCQWP